MDSSYGTDGVRITMAKTKRTMTEEEQALALHRALIENNPPPPLTPEQVRRIRAIVRGAQQPKERSAHSLG